MPEEKYLGHEAWAVFPADDLFGGFFAIGKGEVGFVPDEFLAWEFGGFDGQD